ncbi:MAG: hypothetical protein DMG16_16705 [Acidobacteria bacterium]|nr:MAG: hypothetical protein DMG16_16705 [Acidobacteriota bacterium]
MRNIGVRKNKNAKNTEVELDIGSLFSDLSEMYNRTILLTEKLRTKGYKRSSDEVFEIGILLNHALRISGDALSHLPL